MTEDLRNQAVIDKFEIIEVASISLRCRDSGDWERLAECFHPDAKVSISWFSGNARDFLEQSRKMMSGHPSADRQNHMMGNPFVTLKGNRAVCEYYLILHQRRTIDGYEFDLQTWSTSVDLFEKRDGTWRIAKRTNIYEKDRMDPYNPAEVPASYFEQMDLSRYPAALRYHCYRNERSSGRPPSANLVLKGTPEERAARKEATEWLVAG